MEAKKSYYAIIPAKVRYDEELTASAKLLYGEITALCNDKGYCWATNDYFAKLYGTSDKTIMRWVKNLADKGYIKTEVKVFRYQDGTIQKRRYIHIDNFGSNHPDKNVPDHPDKNVPDHPDKNVPYNNTIKNNTVNNNTNDQMESEFEEVWQQYPKKQGRQNAYKAFLRARKAGVDKDTILAGLKAYNAFLTRNKTDSRYIKQGSTWFNQECWNDEYDINTKEEPPKDERFWWDKQH